MGRSIRGGLRLQNTPLGCICRLAGCRASRLLLSFFLSKRKEQSLSALRAAPSGQLRSETPLRRQKCSLRKSISPDLGPRASPAGWLASKRACGRSATGDQGAALTPSPSGTWATPNPLKRVDLNFRPYEGVCGTKGSAWSLGLVGVTPIQSVKGRGIVSPCTRLDSRHPLKGCTPSRRTAPGRVWPRALARPGEWTKGKD